MKTKINRHIAVRDFVEAERLLEEFIREGCPEEDIPAYTTLLDWIRPQAAVLRPHPFWAWFSRRSPHLPRVKP